MSLPECECLSKLVADATKEMRPGGKLEFYIPKNGTLDSCRTYKSRTRNIVLRGPRDALFALIRSFLANAATIPLGGELRWLVDQQRKAVKP